MPVLRHIYNTVKTKKKELLLTGRSSFFGPKYSHPDFGQKKGISDFLVIGYPYSENTCNFIYVTSLLII